MSRPAILVVTSTYPRRADDILPRFVHELSRRVTSEFDVHVLAPSTPGATAYEQMDGVHVHRFRYCLRQLETLANVEGFLPALKAKPWRVLLLPFFFIAEVRAIGQLARHYNAALIHAHWIVPQGFAVWFALHIWRMKIPVIVTCHGADLFALNGRLFKSIKRRVLASATAVTVVSEAARMQALALGARIGQLYVFPMGVDLAHVFTPDPSVPREPHTLLFVGRLNEKKGADVLIRATALIRRHVPDVKVEIAGYGPDRPLLESLAAELSVADIISFLGAVEQRELPNVYRRAACLVFPSVIARSGDQEGLGLVLVEALGCGCPVVASRLAAVTDVIEDGHTGWLFSPADSDDLAAKIIYVLRHPGQALHLAWAGREKVLGRNDWENVSRNYARLFGSALANSSACAPAS